MINLKYAFLIAFIFTQSVHAERTVLGTYRNYVVEQCSKWKITCSVATFLVGAEIWFLWKHPRAAPAAAAVIPRNEHSGRHPPGGPGQLNSPLIH